MLMMETSTVEKRVSQEVSILLRARMIHIPYFYTDT